MGGEFIGVQRTQVVVRIGIADVGTEMGWIVLLQGVLNIKNSMP